jgi:hypothetical protein
MLGESIVYLDVSLLFWSRFRCEPSIAAMDHVGAEWRKQQAFQSLCRHSRIYPLSLSALAISRKSRHTLAGIKNS